MNEKVAAVILAAGSGSRMKMDITKQRLTILGKSVLRRTAEAFDACGRVSSITVVVRGDEVDFAEKELHGIGKLKNIVIGGQTRPESARIGFLSLSDSADYVAIHDAARCLVTPSMIESVINDAIRYGAATASSRITDTVKICDGEDVIRSTLDRRELRLVQTPQVFRCDLYSRALLAAGEFDDRITDDNMLLERIGIKIYCTDTGKRNIKITEKEDALLAEFLIINGENA